LRAFTSYILLSASITPLDRLLTTLFLLAPKYLWTSIIVRTSVLLRWLRSYRFHEPYRVEQYYSLTILCRRAPEFISRTFRYNNNNHNSFSITKSFTSLSPHNNNSSFTNFPATSSNNLSSTLNPFCNTHSSFNFSIVHSHRPSAMARTVSKPFHQYEKKQPYSLTVTSQLSLHA
jgi:hypothetical protein